MLRPHSPLTEFAQKSLVAPKITPYVNVVLEFGGNWKIVECEGHFYVGRHDKIQTPGYPTIESAVDALKVIANPKDFNLTEGFDFEDEYHVEYTNKNTKVDVNKAGYGEW